MKILMVSPSYFPIVGGAEAVVRNLSIKLNEIGVSTDVMTFNMNQKWKPTWREKIEKIDGVKIIRIPALRAPTLNVLAKEINFLEIAFNVHVIPKLSFMKRLKDYDILHFHDDVDLSFPFFSHLVKKTRIFHCHSLSGSYMNSLSSYRKNPFSRSIFRKIADKYIIIRRSARDLLIKLGVDQSKITFLPNPVDVDRFRPEKKMNKTENLIIFVARLMRRKGLHVLLKALSYLKNPIHLVIIGPSREDKYYTEILNTINTQKRKTNHKISYLGFVNSKRALMLYQKASVFVCPSLEEEFGIVNLEALSCETPVVASNVGGIPEIVHDHINGILVPPNDPIELANAIQYLLDNKKIRIKYGREGRRQVLESFSCEVIIKRLCEIYEEAINS